MRIIAKISNLLKACDSLFKLIEFQKIKYAFGSKKYNLRASEFDSPCDIARIIAKINKQKLRALAERYGVDLPTHIRAKLGNLRHKIINQQAVPTIHNDILADFLEEEINSLGLFFGYKGITQSDWLQKLERRHYCERRVFANIDGILISGSVDCSLLLDGRKKGVGILDIKHYSYNVPQGYLIQAAIYAISLNQMFDLENRGYNNYYLIIANLSKNGIFFDITKPLEQDLYKIERIIQTSYENQRQIIKSRKEFFNQKSRSYSSSLCDKCFFAKVRNEKIKIDI